MIDELKKYFEKTLKDLDRENFIALCEYLDYLDENERLEFFDKLRGIYDLETGQKLK